MGQRLENLLELFNMTAPTNNPIAREADGIVTWLQSITEDRGTMARLRCLLNPNLRQRGWAAVSRIGGIGHDVRETVAGLFALHPCAGNEDKPPKNLGDSCRLLKSTRQMNNGTAPSGKESGESPWDVRFRRILSADRKEMRDLLPHLFLHLKSESIPVDYRQLYIDLRYWGDIVRQKWAIHYWNNQPEQDNDTSVSE